MDTMDEIHKNQNPPYSKGMLMMEIHRKFRAKKFTNDKIFHTISEPVLAQMGRYDYVYCDPNFARYSLVRLEGYQLFSENMAKRYPGYILDKQGHIVNMTDTTVNMDELPGLLRSKDIEKYEKEKEKFFGFTSRYTESRCKRANVRCFLHISKIR